MQGSILAPFLSFLLKLILNHIFFARVNKTSIQNINDQIKLGKINKIHQYPAIDEEKLQ